MLKELCKSQLMGAPVQHLLKLVTKLFKMLDASFKAMKAPPPDAGDVLEAVCTELCPAVYAMLSFTGSCDTSESAKKVEREAVVPALVGQIEKFEVTIAAGKKSSTDLPVHEARPTATSESRRGEVSKAITDAMPSTTTTTRRRRARAAPRSGRGRRRRAREEGEEGRHRRRRGLIGKHETMRARRAEARLGAGEREGGDDV